MPRPRLQMLKCQLWRCSEQTAAYAFYTDRVISHKAVSASDKVKGAFRFSDAGFAGYQHTDAAHLHQHAVDRDLAGQAFTQQFGRDVYRLRTDHLRRQHGNIDVICYLFEFQRRLQAFCHQNARGLLKIELSERSLTPLGIHFFKERYLIVPDHLNSSGTHIVIEACQRKPQFLHPVRRDVSVVQPAAAAATSMPMDGSARQQNSATETLFSSVTVGSIVDHGSIRPKLPSFLV